MGRRLLVMMLVAGVVVSGQAGALPTRGAPYIVVFKPDAPPGAEEKSADEMQSRGAHVRHRYGNALRGFAATLSSSEVDELRADPDVAYLDADTIVHETDTETPVPSWGIDRIDQASLPLDNSYTFTADGTGVNVYVIDSGIRITHQEFAGRAANAFDAVDGTFAVCNGHGTHVAGTIGGTTVGVAKNVDLFSVRVLDCTGNGPVSDVIQGIDWVTKNRVAPAVVNMSLGGSPSTALDNAVAGSIASGITYVVAAGNAATNQSPVDACTGSPARVGPAITVGATTSEDVLASYSDFGPCVDLFAPGSGITSAWITSDTDYAVHSGTSMATPHVAGAAALYLQTHPSASPQVVRNFLVSRASTAGIALGTDSPNRVVYTLGVAPSKTTGVIVDSWGGVHPFTAPGAPQLNAVNAPYWWGWDIANGVAISADGTGGYTLDGWGGLHAFHFQNGADPAVLANAPYWPNSDIARGLALAGGGGYVLDGWGGLHAVGVIAGATGGPYWQGQDLARGIALMPDGTGGYVVDAWGGLHRFAVGAGPLPPTVSGAPYWPGWDIARGVTILPDGTGGYVLDGRGGLHPFGIGGAPAPPVPTTAPYWPNADLARGASTRT